MASTTRRSNGQKTKQKTASNDQNRFSILEPVRPGEDERQDGASTASWLTGGGEMGKLIREKDWSQTPLGPIEQWPQSLRTTVSICLASNFPINIIWGPSRVQIYNDGYWPICGDKHPHSMGQDFKQCWFSAWDAIGEPFEHASAGQTDFLVNQRMFLDRNGYLEETFFTFSFSPIRDESGGVGGLFHPVTEMTQQTLAERRLRVLRQLADRTGEAKSVASACVLITETLAEYSLDVPFALIYLLDAKGKQAFLAANTGLGPGSELSPPIVELDAPGCWPFAQAAADRQIVQVDNLAQRLGPLDCGPYPEPPNTAFVLPLHISGLEHPFGLVVAGVSPRRPLDEAYHTFYVMLREGVTNALNNARAYEEERKRAEALAEIDRAKTRFFSNVSHEFRTPLTLMLGPLEDTLAEAGLSPSAQERLQVAHRNSQRLLKLVNTLLDFSRLEAGRIEAVFEPVDLAHFTADLASVFRSAIERAGVKLSVDCPSLPELVYVDREMWEKIVLNLLSNAFKYTFEGEIEVKLRPAGDRVELTVRDTGAGIPAEALPHLFERFHRVRGVRGRSYEGSGIGLALVQELVKLHGGTVRVESEVDQGSRFIVAIPFGKAHLPADRIGAARSLVSTGLRGEAYVEEALQWLPPNQEASVITLSPSASAPSALASSRILLVDDNSDLREYVRRLLVQSGYDVVAVNDGHQALQAAHAHPPDLVLTDVMMPHLDGFGLLKALRTSEPLKTVPVILLSARAGEEARIEGMEAGADDYLVKPFSARELLARVEAHLRLHQVRRETEQDIAESEEKYRTLFNSIDEGFCIIEVIFDEAQKPVDYRFIEVNPTFERQTGIQNAVGNCMRQIAPQHEANWFEIYGRVALTGQPERFEDRAEQLNGRWYEGYAFRIGKPEERKVAVLFNDITGRKRREADTDFLAEVTADLAALSTPNQIVQTVGAKIGDYLSLTSCNIIDITASGNEGKISFAWNASRVPPYQQQQIRLETYVTEAFIQACRAGKSSVVSDTQTDPATHAGALATLNIRAMVAVPFLHGGAWQSCIVVTDASPREWRPAEIGLIEEVSNRLFSRLERARAEERLRESEERLRLLLESATDFAIFTMDTAGVINSWNTGAERVFGWSEAEALGQPGAIIFTPEDRAINAPEQEMKTARQTGRALDERFHLRKDGSRLFVSGSMSSLYQGKKLEGYVKIARDLTERKRMEEALRLAHDELEQRVQERTHELSRANVELQMEVGLRQQAEEQLRQITSRLTLAEQEERRRISQILHDDLQQLLYGIQLKIEFISRSVKASQQAPLLAHATQVINWIDQAITITRQLTVDLSPPALDGEGLTDVLSWLVTQMQEQHNLLVKVKAEQSFPIEHKAMRVLLFQIIRELLFNVVKHAQTDQAEVALWAEAGQLVIRVSDEGRGFDTAAIQAEGENSFGLRHMRERLELFGGSMEIVSRPGGGTQVTVYTPITV